MHLVANRVRPRPRRPSGCGRSSTRLGQEPLAWIAERAAYADLAEQGLAVFDKPQRAYLRACARSGRRCWRRSG